jgi:hypothetical protein
MEFTSFVKKVRGAVPFSLGDVGMGRGPQKFLLGDHLQRSKTQPLTLHRRKGLSLGQTPLPVDARFSFKINCVVVQNIFQTERDN